MSRLAGEIFGVLVLALLSCALIFTWVRQRRNRELNAWVQNQAVIYNCAVLVRQCMHPGGNWVDWSRSLGGGPRLLIRAGAIEVRALARRPGHHQDRDPVRVLRLLPARHRRDPRPARAGARLPPGHPMTRRGSRPGTARRPPTTRNPAARSVEESATTGISTGPMAGQTVLVTGGTGGTGGIGQATTAGLAAMGTRVGITGATRPGPGPRRLTSLQRPATLPWIRSPRTCQPRPRCAGWPARSWPPTRGWTCWSTTRAGSRPPARSPPMAWNTPSPSTTWPRSCSPACSWTGSRPAPRPGS
jgi:hypothetical protein